MFMPMIFLFTILAFAVYDLKSPDLLAQNCKILAIGPEAEQYLNENNLLYQSSGQSVHNIALECDKNGTVVINNFDVSFSDNEPGDTVELTHRNYKYLPDRWDMDIYNHTATQN